MHGAKAFLCVLAVVLDLDGYFQVAELSENQVLELGGRIYRIEVDCFYAHKYYELHDDLVYENDEVVVETFLKKNSKTSLAD